MTSEASEAPVLSLDHLKKELDVLHHAKHRTVRSALYASLSEPASGRAVVVNVLGSETSFRVVETRGELDLRRKLAREEDPATVYIVPFARKLPRDLETGFATGRLWWPQVERTLPRRFGARAASHRLLASRLRHVALREGARTYAHGDAPSIDLDEAWLTFLRDRFGVKVLDTEAQLFALSLVDRDGKGQAVKALLGGVDRAREELRAVIERRLGSCAVPILDAWLDGGSVELAALTLVGEATRGALADPRSAAYPVLAAVLEARVTSQHGHPLRGLRDEKKGEGLAKLIVELGYLAGGVWARLSDPQEEPLRRALANEAETILSAESVRPLAIESNRLPLAFDLRVAAFVGSLQALLKTTSAKVPVALVALDLAAASLKAHEVTPTHPGLVDQIDMAGRLAAYLAEPDVLAGESAKAEAIQLARFQLDIGGWVDHARHVTRADGSGPLGKNLHPLVARVDARRDELDRRFADALKVDRRSLRGPERIGGRDHEVVLIEDALAKTAFDWLETAPDISLLVICMDGMSTANWAELWPSFEGSAWVPVSKGPRSPVLAHVPTLTKLSRTALFSGRALAPGDSLDTKLDGERLAKHPAIAKLGAKSTVLLRSDVMTSAGAVSDDVTREIAGDKRVVAVVVNAIDDQLKGSAQLRVKLTLEHIPALRELFRAAESKGRVVLVTSDHGNIASLRFLGARARPAPKGKESVESGARHRLLKKGEQPEDDEVALPIGALVAPTEYDRVAVAVSETVRYTSLLHAGEHGGASLAEAIAPFTLLAPRGLVSELEAAGVYEVQLSPPAFWNRDVASVEAPKPVEPSPKPRAANGKRKVDEQVALPFAGANDASPDLARKVFKSKLFAAQIEGVSEASVGDVRRATEALIRSGGTMTWDAFAVAMEIEMGTVRIPGFVDRLERVLNFDSEPVIEANRKTQRVQLDTALLRRVFLEDDDG